MSPFTAKAQRRAHAAGPDAARAYQLLEHIQSHSETLAKFGEPVPALPPAASAILEQAAAGKPVPQPQLDAALKAAAKLDQRLTFAFLKLPLRRLLFPGAPE